MEIKDLDPFAFQVFSRYYQKFHIFFPDYSTEEVLKIWIKTGRYDDKLFTGGCYAGSE